MSVVLAVTWTIRTIPNEEGFPCTPDPVHGPYFGSPWSKLRLRWQDKAEHLTSSRNSPTRTHSNCYFHLHECVDSIREQIFGGSSSTSLFPNKVQMVEIFPVCHLSVTISIKGKKKAQTPKAWSQKRPCPHPHTPIHPPPPPPPRRMFQTVSEGQTCEIWGPRTPRRAWCREFSSH